MLPSMKLPVISNKGKELSKHYTMTTTDDDADYDEE
jgi:hypothetical protein